MSIVEVLKKYWKYIIPITILFIIILIFVLFFSIPRVKYKYDDNKKAYLVESIYGNASSYKIKSSYDNKDVYAIGDRAFYSKNVKNIIFEENSKINTIKRLAFSECKNLEYIDLSNILYFENSAFSYCENLNVKELNAKEIGMSAFYGCKNIKSIVLNDGLHSIGSYAFSKTGIEELNIPSTVMMIYNDAFSDMESLKTINVYAKFLSSDSKEYLNSIENVTINYL